MTFVALVTDKSAEGVVASDLRQLDESDLPEGDVTVAVEWAGFNYKDGLALKGLGKVVRTYPHVAGIDFAGTVLHSGDARYHRGQKVILTGWRVGEWHWGGFAQRARVKADWLVPMPTAMTARTAMVLGTAGLTAMAGIQRLIAEGMSPEQGEVLVTGASGGVGSLAVMALARLGYRVAAVTGRPEHEEQLKRLGAETVMARTTLETPSPKVLESERWAGAIDSVAGPILGTILKQMKSDAGVASIGNAADPNFAGNVAPFILRGVSIYGINSPVLPFARRMDAWQRLATLFEPEGYEELVSEKGLGDLPALADDIVAGKVRGRAVIDPNR